MTMCECGRPSYKMTKGRETFELCCWCDEVSEFCHCDSVKPRS